MHVSYDLLKINYVTKRETMNSKFILIDPFDFKYEIKMMHYLLETILK